MQEALKLLEGAGAPQPLAVGYSRLASFYESRGEAPRALDYMKRAWHTAGHDRR
jgi:hypothetical protein